MDAFMYENLISTFFVEKKLINSRPERLKNCFEYVMRQNHYSTSTTCDKAKAKIANLDVTFIQKWRASKYIGLQHFKEVNEDWMHRILQLPSLDEPNKRSGRPKISGFDNLSERSKKRRADELTECELEKLLLASAQAAKKSGETDMEYVLKLLYKDRELAKKLRDLLKAEERLAKKPKLVKMNPDRALTHLLDNRFSVRQYTNTRLLAKEHGSDIFPAYNKIREAKIECRPPAECFKLNDVCAALPLQSLLNHTTSRLLLLQEDVINALKVDNNEVTIKLEAKWGGDGSSDQSQFNQKYDNVESTENSDGNLFATTLVPLRMTTNGGNIVWNNGTPQSPRWCRPLRLQFAKETPELTREIFQSVQEEIRELTPYMTTIGGKKISVTYKLYLTMIDGKVHSVVTHTKSSLTCTICKANPKQFNNLTNLTNRFKPKEGTLNNGISVMHLWIRSLEFLLHISYRLDVKPFPKWQMRGPVLKQEVKRRKLLLQERFWDKMSLRVDFPSKKGCGNSNSGPVARRAFSQPELLAEILEVDVDLVKKISTILIALSCQLPLDIDLFADFCEKTAHYYVSKYDWYPMAQSIHKVLIHSRDLMLASDLPLGVLAEDAAESCNKLYRHNRQFHARNVSRQHNLMDVFNRALDTSDPIISSFGVTKRLNSRRNRKNIPTEVIRLLKAPDPVSEEDETLLSEGNDDDGAPLDEILDGLDELCLPADPIHGDDDDEDEEDDEEEDGEEEDGEEEDGEEEDGEEEDDEEEDDEEEDDEEEDDEEEDDEEEDDEEDEDNDDSTIEEDDDGMIY